MKKLDLLYIHPAQDVRDKIIPMGVIGLLNSIDCTKKGVFHHEVSDKLLLSTKIVAMDLHWFFHLRAVESIAKWIKSVNPSIKIVIGGYTATIFSDIIIDKFDVDYIVVGDAEKPFKLLIENILKEKPLKSVPNIVAKKFKTKQSYTLTKQDFNLVDNISCDWFSSYQKTIKKQRKKEDHYLFIPTVRGCHHNCEWCYGSIKNQHDICKRRPVIRDAKYIKKDILRCSNDKNIPIVSIMGDFIELHKLGLVTSRFVSTILSEKYDVGLYYEFYNLPSIENLQKLKNCFKSCVFTISFLKNHGQSLEFNSYKKIKEIAEYCDKNNIKLYLYGDEKFQLMKNFGKFFMKQYPNVKFVNDSEWRIIVPYPKKNTEENLNQFIFFYSITHWYEYSTIN